MGDLVDLTVNSWERTEQTRKSTDGSRPPRLERTTSDQGRRSEESDNRENLFLLETTFRPVVRNRDEKVEEHWVLGLSEVTPVRNAYTTGLRPEDQNIPVMVEGWNSGTRSTSGKARYQRCNILSLSSFVPRSGYSSPDNTRNSLKSIRTTNVLRDCRSLKAYSHTGIIINIFHLLI